MKPIHQGKTLRPLVGSWIGLLVNLWLGGTAPAQLAITEVMSLAATNHATSWVTNQSDFWELTNFGPTPIDLAGYRFSDMQESPRPLLIADGDPPLVLGPGQSAIFFRDKETTSVEAFRAWWGACLGPGVPVRKVPRTPGFDQIVDGLRLWDANANLIDRVDFGVARQGVSFVSDATTGEFGVFSERGVCGACMAATADDLGSPGVACGPIALHIVQQPAPQVVCAGTEAAFSVRATGLPRPRFQWFHNGTAIPGATGARYVVTNVQPSQAGLYQVAAVNGLEFIVSSSTTLTVTTVPSAPSILVAPADSLVYTGQTARFAVTVCAYPVATYQWLRDGVPLADETNRVLLVPDCAEAMSGAQYCVRLANPLGTLTVCARLTVTQKPLVRVTEIMASQNLETQHADWFELSNYGGNAVPLLGYRFSDRLSLTAAAVITQAVTLQPGQSAILVEGMTPAAFREWWGADNLPPGLPIITYAGLGFSERGDQLYLWNATAIDPADTVDSRSFAGSQPGVSKRFGFGEEDCFFGCDNLAGMDGAFHAAMGGDIGSPGFITNGPPRVLRLTRDAQGTHVRWHGVEGKVYRLEYNPGLHPGGWKPVGETLALEANASLTDPAAAGVDHRFYRIVQVTP